MSDIRRVLLVVRPSVHERGGGDFTQAKVTQAGLRGEGIEVDIVASATPDATGYDIAHVFGVFDPEIATVQIDACRASGAPIALSPIWWDLYAFFGRSRACEGILARDAARIESRLRRLRATPPDRLLRRAERRKYDERLGLQTSLMRRADVLLPNSAIEAHQYMERLQLYDRPMAVVHNAVDRAVPPVSAMDEPTRSGVVCLARIERKKNQATLLYALRDLDVDVTLAGGWHDQPYLELCRRWASPRVSMPGNLEYDAAFALLRSAAVCILPSWAETPGIATIEAALCGARIVASNDGTEIEYFGENALYVDPLDP
ncbi:MAG TPA: glycosyltransferase family 4 protein, partial [Candidatus Tumulicola sp.]